MNGSAKYTREGVITLLLSLDKRLGGMPKKQDWQSDKSTPSDMPIRMLFGNWTKFLKAAGYTPRKSDFTIEARLNSIRAHKGQRSYNSKGGRIVDQYGYVQVWMPTHPNAKLAGYIHEHRLVMSNLLGRPLEKHESVHHKNGNRQDNRIENLELWSTIQPSGQRVEDKLKYAHEIISKYGGLFDTKTLKKPFNILHHKKTKIESAWFAVIEFIEYYNKSQSLHDSNDEKK